MENSHQNVRRWKDREIDLDWPLIIGELHAIFKMEEIGELTGIHKNVAQRVKNEFISPPPDWDKAIRLIDAYLYFTGKESLPKLREPHENNKL